MIAEDICRLVYNNTTLVGYRFRLTGNEYADTDADTFNKASRGIKINVVQSLPVYIVGDDVKTRNEIDFNIDVRDISGNVDLVREYINSVLQYKAGKVKAQAEAGKNLTYVGDNTHGYAKYTISTPQDFIKEFRGMCLSRELLMLNLEKYGLSDYSTEVIKAIRDWESENS